MSCAIVVASVLERTTISGEAKIWHTILYLGFSDVETQDPYLRT